MNPATNKTCLLALALLGGALYVSGQTTTNEPPAQPHAPKQERATVETRLQQIVAGQLARGMNEEQRAKYREAMDANQPKIQAIQTDIRAARKAMLELQLADKFDEAAFRAKAETTAKLQAETELLNAQAFAKVRPLLTAEQVAQIKNQQFINRAYGGSEARPGVFPNGVALPPTAEPPASVSEAAKTPARQ